MHERTGGAVLPRLLALLCLLCSLSASAQPYEYLAVYEPMSETAKPLRLEVTQNGLLPDGGEQHRLDRIVVHFKTDGVSLSALSLFSRLRFKVESSTVQAETELLKENIEKLPDREFVLVRWRGDDRPEPISNVKITVEAVYTAEFLCLQENALLQSERNVERFPVPHFYKSAAGSLHKPSDWGSFERWLIRDGETTPLLIYTFCSDSSDKDRGVVAWSEAQKDHRFLFEEDEKDKSLRAFRQAHKRALSDRIVRRLNDRFSSFGRSLVSETSEPDYDNVRVEVKDALTLSIVKSVGSLLLVEEAGGTVQPLADLIDQDAEVALRLSYPHCYQFPYGSIMKSPWVFELEVPDGKDGKTRKAKVDLGFQDGCTRKLLVPWKDYLNQRVTFRVIYRVPERADIVVFNDSFNVYNLGLITTAPIITEIVSAAQKASPRDVEATSSIPVSFALPISPNRSASVAVTFPFTVSFNTRTFPNLAEYFAVAPSISLVAGSASTSSEEEEANVRLALGIGVNLARAFHFGYAWAPSDGGRYVLLGISIPDLLPLLKKGE
ncbi:MULTISPECIES: hypothetical protein [unclassified Corallococcus]|uniref:hypothetical protein n=1 Tax=unclassified Corallococcus TaxID=2685029 RepID=UPI001A8D589E|nr:MULTISPECIES: hypothetical protein [unclassified Corallococcus]MBN9681582.1 hypothetical protein [Corallococcus sp. NCSPR001]WAS86843.1 hypothetical protein O0N60_07675 [Corallococcus sp. NCRR]